MADTDWGNQTVITEFILLGFRELRDLQILLFLLFLVIYLATVAGNSLIVTLIVADQHLHSPMYFFLGNLSCLETCYSSTILPRLLAGLLTGDRAISVSGCLTQLFFFGAMASTECYLLAVIPALFGTDEHQVFPPIGCRDTHLIVILDFIFSFLFTLPPFLLTLTSYICIIATILRIPSTTGRQKAFSTCSSHLIVVTLFYGTLMSVVILPTLTNLRVLNKVLSLCYTVLTPLVNPLIYSLRNREVREALSKAISQYVALTKTRRDS
nr:olfactory receptor 1020-like [Pelodiscus sinensis]|eukprot:XP_014435301.1 olfactory receptor 1020-like [Pelodiscus sinensis]